MKECKYCEQDKELSEFPDRKGTPDGKSYSCTVCSNYIKEQRRVIKQEKKEYRQTVVFKKPGPQRDEARKLKAKDSSLRINFNITLDQYNKMLKKQNGVCALCGSTNANGYALAVDHCHTTGTIRSLLCMNCNIGLGNFKDNEKVLAKAIKYLKKYKKKSEI